MWLHVADYNPNAIAFYNAYGFQRTEVNHVETLRTIVFFTVFSVDRSLRRASVGTITCSSTPCPLAAPNSRGLGTVCTTVCTMIAFLNGPSRLTDPRRVASGKSKGGGRARPPAARNAGRGFGPPVAAMLSCGCLFARRRAVISCPPKRGGFPPAICIDQRRGGPLCRACRLK